MPIDRQVALAGGKGYTRGMANLELLQTTSADTEPGGAPLSGLEFPGCEPVPMTEEEVVNFEGRLEFWDAETATAWMVCEPTSPYHERPSQKLSALGERIAAVRGSPIECYGAMDLLVRDGSGKPKRIMQADQSAYLHPGRANLPGILAMVIGENDFPDLVLEVDHTTDVRRGKLQLYESWGFPEVWVEVPERRAPSRPRSRLPGLTIHVLEDGAYRELPESRAFPGWTAEEIHAAMNEAMPSAATCAVLERVGLALGAREGTGPDDDPLLRSLREHGRARGRAEGRMQGKGEARTEMARQILLSRGIDVSAEFSAALVFLGELSEQAIVSAALACASEADFLMRLR